MSEPRPGLGSILSRKFYRAGEALHLAVSYAADSATRRALLKIYASLSNRELYDQPIELRLKIARQIFPFQMRYSDIFILGEIFHEGQYRLQSRLPAAPIIVDAGANIGASAVWFLGWNPEATIHAFEPAGDNYRFLVENLGARKGVKLHQMALGRERGTAVLHHGEFGGMHSLMLSGENGVSETVPVTTLAEYMEMHGIERIDLLKLDVEGSELDALIGLGERIKHVDVIIGEVHEKCVDVQTFYDFLDQNGFRLCWKRHFREGHQEQVHGFEARRDNKSG